jgi:ABC-2 type transport system permease protein
MWAVMRAEYLHIIRDPLSMIIALFIPLIMLFLFSYCLTFEFKELPIVVYDMDQSKESMNYIESIDRTSYFHIARYLNNYEEAKSMLEINKTLCAIIIPSDFSKQIHKNLPARVQTLVDGSNPSNAYTINNYLSAINANYSIKMEIEYFEKNNISVNLEPVKLIPRTWYNQSLREFTYTVTGIISLSIMGFVPILSALSIVREKESGSIQQIFISPVKPYEYIAGKMSPYVILLTFDFFLVTLFALWWFALPFQGSFAILFLSTFLVVFICVAIGFFISTLTKSQLVAMLLSIIFTLMPAIIWSDALTPIENSAKGARIFSFFFPARYYTKICRAQILKGADLSSYWDNMAALLIHSIVIFGICALIIRNKKM